MAKKKKSSKKTVSKKKGTKKSATKTKVKAKSKKSSKTSKKKATAKSSPKAVKKASAKPILKISPVDLHAGDNAPNFSVQDQNNATVSLSDFSGKKLVLYFYPKDMTPGCTVEACDFRDSLERLKGMNVGVLGVSMDNEALHQKFIEKHGLNFDLLSDKDGKVCYDYGVLKEKNNYGKKYVGIVRKTFIIGDGKILKVYPQVKVEGHVQKIIDDLNSL